MVDTPSEKNRLTLSILNYFAAFTETRFNFRTLINYRWTNDELTLDLSLFSGFTQTLFEHVKTGDNTSISIRPNEHTLSLLGDDILIEIEKALSDKFDRSYLKVCIEQELKKLEEKQKAILVSDEGAKVPDVDGTTDTQEEKIRQKASLEFDFGDAEIYLGV